MNAGRGLSIGRLAEATGVNLETIRYYERIGLMPEPARTEGGHRVYEAAHEGRLAFVRRGRDLGFTIDDIRALLALAEPDRRTCADVLAIAEAHLEAVRGKIADLKALEGLLSATVDRCENGQSPECAVLKMLEGGARADRESQAGALDA
jgi:MerR family mercuric resistance operon transcriptional regulator